jgi:hypothetical protein
MRSSTIASLNEWFERFPHLRGEPARTNDDIVAIERRLGVSFSDGYKEYLGVFGGADVGRRTVYGLYLPKAIQDSTTYRSENNKTFLVEDATVFYRGKNWPGVREMYVVSVDYSGNPIAVDSSGVVWISDHNRMECEMVHSCFEDWINDDCLTILNDEDEEDS